MKTLLLIAVASLAVALPANAETTATPQLTGIVGPGFNITLRKGTLANPGAKVETLRQGKYVITLYDRSDFHNFDLMTSGKTARSSTGAKVMTTVPKVGKSTFTVTLTRGKWHFQCDPHSLTMKGNFTVTR